MACNCLKDMLPDEPERQVQEEPKACLKLVVGREIYGLDGCRTESRDIETQQTITEMSLPASTDNANSASLISPLRVMNPSPKTPPNGSVATPPNTTPPSDPLPLPYDPATCPGFSPPTSPVRVLPAKSMVSLAETDVDTLFSSHAGEQCNDDRHSIPIQEKLAERDLSNLWQRVDELRQADECLAEKFELLLQEQQNLRLASPKVYHDLHNGITGIQKANTTLQQTVSDQATISADLHQRLSDIQNAKSALIKRNRDLNATLVSQQEAISNLQAQSSEFQNVTFERNRLSWNVNDLKKLNRKANNRINWLIQKHKDAEAAQTQACRRSEEALQNEVASIAAERQGLQAEIATLESELEEHRGDDRWSASYAGLEGAAVAAAVLMLVYFLISNFQSTGPVFMI